MGVISTAARARGLSPAIVAGVVAQESGGIYARPDGSANPFAIRPEPAFWAHYGDVVRAFAAKTTNLFDDRWVRFPDLAGASYGLMQVLYDVALELGYVLRFPTELCDPEVGVGAGCEHLSNLYRRTGGDIRAALLRYNGGGDPSYPDKVLTHVSTIRDAKVFPDE